MKELFLAFKNIDDNDVFCMRYLRAVMFRETGGTVIQAPKGLLPHSTLGIYLSESSLS